MEPSRRVVITGVGTVCPIGIGESAFWSSLRAQKSGIGPLRMLSAANLPVGFGGEIVDFDAKQYVRPRKSLKVMSREIQHGVAAAALATEHAGFSSDQVDPDRLGVILGCDFLYCDQLEELIDAYRACMPESGFEYDRWGSQGIPQIFPLWMLRYLPNMAACHVGIAHDARGPNNTITLGEASGILAMTECVEVIRRGQADVMLGGGIGSRLNITPIMFRGDENLSHRSDQPQRACRPFDRDRDGVVNGEGAAVFVLEELEFARRRGANIVAELLGGCSRFEQRLDDARPDGSAIRASIRGAMAAAGVTTEDIDHVNANGAGTVEEDPLEAQAIRDCLGDVPVTAPRSFQGDLGAGSGAAELAASVLALRHGEVPVTLNYETPDPHCPVNVVHGSPRPMSGNRAVLKLSQSSTGQAVALVLGRP